MTAWSDLYEACGRYVEAFDRAPDAGLYEAAEGLRKALGALPPEQGAELEQQIREVYRHEGKIPAIRAYRQSFADLGLRSPGLIESRAWVERACATIERQDAPEWFIAEIPEAADPHSVGARYREREGALETQGVSGGWALSAYPSLSYMRTLGYVFNEVEPQQEVAR